LSVFELSGWLGAAFYIGAYFFLSIGKISADKPFYHVLNALGGLCLIVNALGLKDSPNFFINLIWLFIALVTALKIYMVSKKRKVIK
jgi:hypothetical protein